MRKWLKKCVNKVKDLGHKVAELCNSVVQKIIPPITKVTSSLTDWFSKLWNKLGSGLHWAVDKIFPSKSKSLEDRIKDLQRKNEALKNKVEENDNQIGAAVIQVEQHVHQNDELQKKVITLEEKVNTATTKPTRHAQYTQTETGIVIIQDTFDNDGMPTQGAAPLSPR